MWRSYLGVITCVFLTRFGTYKIAFPPKTLSSSSLISWIFPSCHRYTWSVCVCSRTGKERNSKKTGQQPTGWTLAHHRIDCRLYILDFPSCHLLTWSVCVSTGTGNERNLKRLASSPLAGRWLTTTIELIVVFSFLDFPLLSPFLYLQCLRFLRYRKREKLEKIGQQPTGWTLAHGNDGANCHLLFPRNSLLSVIRGTSSVCVCSRTGNERNSNRLANRPLDGRWLTANSVTPS